MREPLWDNEPFVELRVKRPFKDRPLVGTEPLDLLFNQLPDGVRNA